MNQMSLETRCVAAADFALKATTDNETETNIVIRIEHRLELRDHRMAVFAADAAVFIGQGDFGEGNPARGTEIEQLAVATLEADRRQPLATQRMRLSDHHYITRQQLPKLLQSVATAVGVGKSHVAQALGHAACRRGHTVAFAKTSRLLADLAGGHADHTWAARLRRWARPDIVILDDFAMRAFTPGQADDLYELVSERDRRSIIITANRAAADWYTLFPNPVVAESILDRLVNGAHHIHMQGRSYRPNRRPGRTEAAPAGERP
jgi:hypothetical protein